MELKTPNEPIIMNNQYTDECVAQSELQNNYKLKANQLIIRTDPSSLPKTTKYADFQDITFGQLRAAKAILTAIQIKGKGYNIFATGQNGLGKREIITRILTSRAKYQATPPDIICVHNFKDSKKPVLIHLPVGYALQLSEEIANVLNQFYKILTSQISTDVLNTLIKNLLKKYNQFPQVSNFITGLALKLNWNIDNNSPSQEQIIHNISTKYCVNILVTNKPESGAPIVFEAQPNYTNLLGYIEQKTYQGSIESDASMVRSGALINANGGYLIIEAQSLLINPTALEGLKRFLKSESMILANSNKMMTEYGCSTLQCKPTTLNVKVILLGEPDLYYSLLELEPEFDTLFKIRADFHDSVIRNHASELQIVSKMADIVKDARLCHFDNSAQAAILNHMSLLVEDQEKLSLHADNLSQLLHESNFHALQSNKDIVTDKNVDQAIQDIYERSGYLRDVYWEELKNGQQLLSTSGLAIGQVNALTVISHADTVFGMPARLTALIQPSIGTGEILDIERDVDLGGSLHAKGMLIMTSYLRSLFSQYHELNFTASLAFEQSYAQIDGDSATITEACALLSALANVPINQSYAITGSMNQHGEIQAVGGINEKIAGFYDACLEHGLTGEQGVIIPLANQRHLMLREDIIQAVANNQFSIFGINNLNQALSLLTGISADKRTKKGNYHKKSVMGKVLKRLKSWESEEI